METSVQFERPVPFKEGTGIKEYLATVRPYPGDRGVPADVARLAESVAARAQGLVAISNQALWHDRTREDVVDLARHLDREEAAALRRRWPFDPLAQWSLDAALRAQLVADVRAGAGADLAAYALALALGEPASWYVAALVKGRMRGHRDGHSFLVLMSSASQTAQYVDIWVPVLRWGVFPSLTVAGEFEVHAAIVHEGGLDLPSLWARWPVTEHGGGYGVPERVDEVGAADQDKPPILDNISTTV